MSSTDFGNWLHWIFARAINSNCTVRFLHAFVGNSCYSERMDNSYAKQLLARRSKRTSESIDHELPLHMSDNEIHTFLNSKFHTNESENFTKRLLLQNKTHSFGSLVMREILAYCVAGRRT